MENLYVVPLVFKNVFLFFNFIFSSFSYINNLTIYKLNPMKITSENWMQLNNMIMQLFTSNLLGNRSKSIKKILFSIKFPNLGNCG